MYAIGLYNQSRGCTIIPLIDSSLVTRLFDSYDKKDYDDIKRVVEEYGMSPINYVNGTCIRGEMTMFIFHDAASTKDYCSTDLLAVSYAEGNEDMINFLVNELDYDFTIHSYSNLKIALQFNHPSAIDIVKKITEKTGDYFDWDVNGGDLVATVVNSCSYSLFRKLNIPMHYYRRHIHDGAQALMVRGKELSIKKFKYLINAGVQLDISSFMLDALSQYDNDNKRFLEGCVKYLFRSGIKFGQTAFLGSCSFVCMSKNVKLLKLLMKVIKKQRLHRIPEFRWQMVKDYPGLPDDFLKAAKKYENKSNNW